MRIGFFTEGYLPQIDGVTTSVNETAKELEKRGHEVFIIAPQYPGYHDENARVIRIASVKIPKFSGKRIGINIPDKNLRRVFSIDFDIIHGHSGGPITFLGRELAREKKVPYIFTYHTLWNRYTHYFFNGKVVKPKTIEQISKFFGNLCDCVIAPTARVEKELRRYGVKKPIAVIPSGLPVDEFKKAPRGFLRSKIKNEKDPIVLFVGRLAHEKSVEFLLHSFKEVAEVIPGVQLVLIGEGVDRKKLEAEAEKLQIGQCCHFLGGIPAGEMHKVYRDASVFAFASTTETQGLVVAEALSSGVPVVAVNDPAYLVVKNGENGFLVDKEESKFAGKIIEILKDKNLYEALSENASKNADIFSVETMVNKLENVYFDLLDKYNIESVPRIMGENSRAEKIYAAGFIFWATVLIVRFYMLIFYHSALFPKLVIGGQIFYGWEIGVFLILVGLALYLHKRNASFATIAAIGAGIALLANEVATLFLGSVSILSYWNVLNAVPIIAAGFIFAYLTRSNGAERPKFYINTRIQKHINPDNPKLTVVIPAYNEGEFIEPTLKSLLNQTYKNFEIIVVDNNSSDNTAEVAKKFGARVVLQKIKGVAAARQKGFEEALGAIIASTDADSVVPEDWVGEIVKAYENKPELVGFAGLNALYSGAVSARCAGRYLFPIFWRFDKWLSGGWNMAGFNMSCRKSAFEKIGGFDTSLAMGEDIDLSKKLRGAGAIGVDESLVVASSGRRYSKGLLDGLNSYAPWWISKVLLKQDKPFTFKDVRDVEEPESKVSFLIPAAIADLALVLTFLAANL